MHTEKIRDPELAQAVAAAKEWQRVANTWIEAAGKRQIERDAAWAELDKQKALTAMWEKVSDTWRRVAMVSMIVAGAGFIAVSIMSAAIGS